jgi:predicted nucleic acid-binding protein
MLLDSNLIIYSAKAEFDQLRRFLAGHPYSVSAVSRIEVLGYHLLSDRHRQYLADFFQAANILQISDSVVTEAVKLRQTRRMSLGDSIIAGTALDHRLSLATRNTADFNWIKDLPIINPFESTELGEPISG